MPRPSAARSGTAPQNATPRGPLAKDGVGGLRPPENVRHIKRAAAAETAPASVVPRFLSASTVLVDRRGAWGRHQHREYEALFVYRGLYRTSLNDVGLLLPRHSALIVKPGDWHADDCRPPLQLASVRFQLTSGGAEPSRIGLFRNGVAAADQVLAKASDVWPCLDRMREESGSEAVTALIQDGLMSELFWRLVRAFPEDVLSPALVQRSADEAFRRKLARYFADNVDRLPKVLEVAESFSLSERALNERCRAVMGASPARCFMRFKMQRAAELLREEGASVKAVGHALGFRNPFHFSRVFKHHFGVSPRVALTAE